MSNETKKRFSVTLYHETYTEYVVTANNLEEAQEKVEEGEYDFVEDVTVKESEIISGKEFDNDEN